jgi:hypothetical protein
VELLAEREAGDCSGDGVGSARAGPVDQEHSLGVVSQDLGQGVLDDVGVVPGAAAGEEEALGAKYVEELDI